MHVHERGIVHRDIKPANIILIPTTPGLKLVDFGIAKLLGSEAEDASHTKPGSTFGTPAFMAPEQIFSASEVTDRADIYSVAVTLYWCLSGRLPFDESSDAKLLLAHLEAPSPLNPGLRIPRDLEDVVTQV